MRNTYGEIQYLFFSKLYPFEQTMYHDAVYSFLWQLSFEYVGFRNWYDRLFADTHRLQSGREIVICTTADQIVGVSILKKDEEESKICTLRVAKQAQHNGIGKQLILKSIDWLQTDKPFITVRSYKEFQFEKLFQYFGFKKEDAYPGYYGLLGTEITYNGILPKPEGILSRFVLADMRSFLAHYLQKGKYSAKQLLEMYIDQYCSQWAQ